MWDRNLLLSSARRPETRPLPHHNNISWADDALGSTGNRDSLIAHSSDYKDRIVWMFYPGQRHEDLLFVAVGVWVLASEGCAPPLVCVYWLPGSPLLWLGSPQVIGYPNNWVSVAPPAPPAHSLSPDGAAIHTLRAGSHSGKDVFFYTLMIHLIRCRFQPADPPGHCRHRTVAYYHTDLSNLFLLCCWWVSLILTHVLSCPPARSVMVSAA